MWCHGVDYGNIIMITTTTMIPLLPTTITSDDDNNNNNNDNDNNNSENNKTFRRIVNVYGPRFAKIFLWHLSTMRSLRYFENHVSYYVQNRMNRPF